MVFSSLPKSHYEFLGVSQSADARTLRKAFYRLSKTLHPDTTELPQEHAAHKFRQLYEVYELLSDPIRRKTYDESLRDTLKTRKIFLKQIENQKNTLSKETLIAGNRRPLSGGELFSLLLLILSLLFSLMLGIGLAFLNGKELQVRPSWLIPDQGLVSIISPIIRDVVFTTIENPFESTFFGSP